MLTHKWSSLVPGAHTRGTEHCGSLRAHCWHGQVVGRGVSPGFSPPSAPGSRCASPQPSAPRAREAAAELQLL